MYRALGTTPSCSEGRRSGREPPSSMKQAGLSSLEGKLLSPFPSSAGGQSVTHTGPPILVSLANKATSFSCSITYLYTQEFKTFTVSYSYVNLQGQKSVKKQTGCQPTVGTENQTHTTVCQVTPRLPNASATGTYYCTAHWPHLSLRGAGPFILVRGEASLALPGHRARRLRAAGFGA